jgi:hypothetical protein
MITALMADFGKRVKAMNGASTNDYHTQHKVRGELKGIKARKHPDR